MKNTPLISILTASLALQVSVSAQVLINFDFDRNRNGFGGDTVTGAAVLGASGDFWNGLTATSDGAISPAIALNDASNASSGLTLESTSFKSFWTEGQSGGGQVGATLDASSAAQTLRYDWLRGDGTTTLTLSGFNVGDDYKLILYGGQTGGEFAVGSDTRTIEGWGFDEGSANVTDTTLTDGEDYTIYTGTIGASQDLAFTVTNINQGGYFDADGLAGFQIDVTPVPEPSIFALLAGTLGLAAAVSRRRIRA